MPDPLSNSNFVESFLSKVASGRDFSQDIWIEREVKRQGEGGEVTKANSSSYKIVGKQIRNITDLLQDDIDYCFSNGRSVFRFITAIAGSGKTTLLSYFKELIELEDNNLRRSIVVQFELPTKLKASKSFQDFHGKFYSYILARTIWEILHDEEIKIVGEFFLRELVQNDSYNQLVQAKNFGIGFLSKFIASIKSIDVDLQDVFLSVINDVSKRSSRHAFVYLIDELDDAIREDPLQSQQMRAALKSLVNRVSSEDYDEGVRLLMYMAGTSDILSNFINSESASERRFTTFSIALGSGLKDEFRKIREKIDQRIEGAYQTCEGFDEASHKIQDIDDKLKSKIHENMRVLGNYCRDYASSVLEVYGEYFSDKPENHFGGTAKQFKDLIETLCRANWEGYLDPPNYEISFEKINNNSDEHIFNCYASLLKDGEVVASAYGGARNYELLNNYVDKFIQLLKDSSYKADTDEGSHSDIAFIISPVDCSLFLKKKIKRYKINFINSSQDVIDAVNLSSTYSEQNICNSSQAPVDINLAPESVLLDVFQGTSIRQGIISKIIEHRPYKNINEISNVQGIGSSRMRVIQERFDSHEICCRIGVFISYNSRDKSEVDKIVKKLEENKISYWIDDQILGGEEIRKKLEEIICSDQLWAAAICYGNYGPGPWQDVEISSLLQKSVKDKSLIIPVILKSCTGDPEVSLFLKNLKIVDFREKKPKPIDFLIDSIKRDNL
ncbi:MAG: TIR domain-containing protein [Elainellaceae cyanobacterium]